MRDNLILIVQQNKSKLYSEYGEGSNLMNQFTFRTIYVIFFMISGASKGYFTINEKVTGSSPVVATP